MSMPAFKTLAATLAAAALAACALPPEIPRSDALFARIADGMTTDEVRGIAGAPDETMPFPLSHTVAWDYRYYDTWGYMAVFSVIFSADGRAVGRISRRINDGGNHSS